MSKPHLILWGGAWENLESPLSLSDLDSHAKVSYFFLKEVLEKHFNITGIEEFAKISELGEYLREDTVGVVSTFQGGFTQLYTKHPEIYEAIAPLLEGLKFSIIDEVPFGQVKEDRLFTVIPASASLKGRIKSILSPAKVNHMGWCAAPEHCYPEGSDIFTIFIDHGHYAGVDYTDCVFQACANIDADFKILIQTNNGIEEWDKSKPWGKEQYIRANKVPWPEMMFAYRQADVFCLTHLESAGLSAIEAAMCGARIIVPKMGKTSFLNPTLLGRHLDIMTPQCTVEGIQNAIEETLSSPLNRDENHKNTAENHGWVIAANNIARTLLN